MNTFNNDDSAEYNNEEQTYKMYSEQDEADVMADYQRWLASILSIEPSGNNGSIQITRRLPNGSTERLYSTEEHWRQEDADMKNPMRHIQEMYQFSILTNEEQETLQNFIDTKTDGAFRSHTENHVDCRIIKGTVPADKNPCSGDYEYDLFYQATFVPLLCPNGTQMVVCEIGFDLYYERKTITFEYNPQSKTVYYEAEYRSVHDPQEYQRFKHMMYYNNRKKMMSGRNSLPWICFPRTKDGISIPLLMEYIFKNEVNRIVFTN